MKHGKKYISNTIYGKHIDLVFDIISINLYKGENMEMIIQILLFVLIGITVGVFGTLLFFRFDKTWKQILVGTGSTISAGGMGVLLCSHLKVKEENMALMYLALMLALMISVYFVFKKFCILLKNQTGHNIIRILDIVIGYNGFLKDYYESRKKDVDKNINLEGLEKKKVELDNREKYLVDLQSGINEQKQNVLILKLPENSEYVLTNHFIRQIPLYVDHICKFRNNLDKLTNDFIDKFTEDKQHNEICLKGYFAGIGMYIANDLFGTSNEDVRTHFRILKGEAYIQYAVILGDKLSDEKISDIPKGKSMIEKSYELKKSLVASLNPECLYDTKTKWEDFMTITYYNLKKDDVPFLSMGISIKYSEQFKEMLYFINYYKIEDCLHTYINRINRVCDIVETLK